MDAIDPSVLVSACASRQFDFLEMQEQELHNIVMPLDLEVGEPSFAIQPLVLDSALKIVIETLKAFPHACSMQQAPAPELSGPPMQATFQLGEIARICDSMTGACAGSGWRLEPS